MYKSNTIYKHKVMRLSHKIINRVKEGRSLKDLKQLILIQVSLCKFNHNSQTLSYRASFHYKEPQFINSKPLLDS